ncbi:MAG: ankyrin repeat domain-containing protein [Cyanobacteria bacterium P01_E01_bin.42]
MAICYPPILGFFAFIFNFQGTPLHAAAFLGYPKLFPYGSGAVRVGDREGKTPLHYAARRDRVRAIVILLNEGADIHAKDEDGHTALHDAADYGSLQAVKTLVRSGAQIDIGDKSGKIPVQKAAQSGQIEIVRYLLDISPNISRESTSALWSAVFNNWVETAKVAIAKGADIKSERSGKTLLESARSSEMIQMLQEAQAE